MNHCFEICHYQQNVPQHYYLLFITIFSVNLKFHYFISNYLWTLVATAQVDFYHILIIGDSWYKVYLIHGYSIYSSRFMWNASATASIISASAHEPFCDILAKYLAHESPTILSHILNTNTMNVHMITMFTVQLMRYCSKKQSPAPPTSGIDKPHSANLECNNI